MADQDLQKQLDERLLSPEEIFASEDIDTVDVLIPEWKKADGKPGTVRLRMLTGEEMALYLDAIDGNQRRTAMIEIIIRSAVKADGAPLFSGRNALLQLQAKSLKAFAQLQDEILRINGLDKRGNSTTKNA